MATGDDHLPNSGGSTMPRKLRLAVSVFFGLLTVALTACWIYSLWHINLWQSPIVAQRGAYVWSGEGQLILSANYFADVGNQWNPTILNTRYGSADYRSWIACKPTKLRLFAELTDGNGSNSWGAYLPYWLPIVITAICAATPWLPLRPTSFSLRTLLIATTLVAVVLGLAVWAGR